MSELSFLGPEYAKHRAFAVFVAAIVIPILCAGWLNGWRVYAFPLGTFILALGVPLALIVVSVIVPRALEEETEEL